MSIALESSCEYTIGWITALAIERAAATAFLDERHKQPKDFIQGDQDDNVYTFGRIYNHNVVIASLSSGVYGLVSASRTAHGLLQSFPHIKIGLLVGIGAGIPESGVDIRLGDIAVSRPEGTLGGVVQYDTVKAKPGQYERVGILIPPPSILLNALSTLQAEHELKGSNIPKLMLDAQNSGSEFVKNYTHPGVENDRLFLTSTDGLTESEFLREPRPNLQPHIHYGTIASGNVLVKTAEARRALLSVVGQSCICLEMEAAGLMNNFPCLVIRGICDYADSRKTDQWQRYASATAAAFAKELLQYVPTLEERGAPGIKQALKRMQGDLARIERSASFKKPRIEDEEVSEFLRALYTCPYEERKDRNPKRVAGTCEWFSKHHLFTDWLNNTKGSLLWVSADPGCGKSVLARYLVDELLRTSNKQVCYFFFKDDFDDQRTSAHAACAILRQLIISHTREVAQRAIRSYKIDGQRYLASFTKLWADFVTCSREIGTGIILVLDALDECQDRDRKDLISSICEAYTARGNAIKLKILVTSRPYFNIADEFNFWESQVPIIHLNGDDDVEKQAISKEIGIVIEHRLKAFAARRRLTSDEYQYLWERFNSSPQRTYLWAHLTLNILEETPGFMKSDAKRITSNLPLTIDNAYERILSRSPDIEKTRSILNIVLAAREPFTLEMVWHFLAHVADGADDADGGSSLPEFPSSDRIKDAVRQHCGLMVVVIDLRVYFLHQTVREFLLGDVTKTPTTSLPPRRVIRGIMQDTCNWRGAFLIEKCHWQVAQWCLGNLQLLPPLPTAEGLGKVAYENQMHMYWCLNWAHHVQQAAVGPQDRLTDLAMEVCNPSSLYLSRWFKVWWHRSSYQWSVYSDHRRFEDLAVHKLFIELRDLHVWFLLALLLDVRPIAERCLEGQSQKLWENHHKSLALLWAATLGRMKMVELLLQHGAQCATKLIFLKAEMHSQALQRNEKGVQRLVDRSRTDSYYDLYLYAKLPGDLMAIDTFSTNPLSSLLGACGTACSHSLESGDSELHLLSGKCNLQIVRSLCKQGASPFDQNIYGQDPLLLFLSRCSGKNPQHCKEIRSALLASNEQRRQQDYVNSMLHQIARNSEYCESCVDFVFGCGPLLNSWNKFRQPALVTAAGNDNFKLVERMIQAGTDIESRGVTNITALMRACMHSVKLTSILIDSGADIHARDHHGCTPLHWCWHIDTLDILIERGADIDAQASDGRTMLISCVSALFREEAWIQRLLYHGADPTLKDDRGCTALDYAQEARFRTESERERVFKMLKDAEKEWRSKH